MQLAVNKDTILNWEVGRAAPALRQWPALIRFLGYRPFSVNGVLPEQLKAHRRIHGLSQKRLAVMLGVDPSTLARWERGRGEPGAAHAKRIEALSARAPN